MKIIIDRFEGDFAVVEMPDRTMYNLPISLFPNAKEGNVISIEVDVEETKKRRVNAEKLMDEVWDD